MRAQAHELKRLGAKAVLIKGGHAEGPMAVDLLLDQEGEMRLEAPRVQTKHDHGTGCTLSSAIAAELAKGASLREAVTNGEGLCHRRDRRSRRASHRQGQGPRASLPRRLAAKGLSLGHDLQPLLAEPGDGEAELIAGLQEHARVARHADAGWRARGDHVARHERHVLVLI